MARDKAERFDSARALLWALDDVEAKGLTLPIAALPVSGAADRDASPHASPSRDEARSDRLETRHGIEGFRADIAQQLVLMAAASPSYRRVLQELDALLESDADGEITAAFARVWQKRAFEGPFERPLLFLAALRADARVEGASHPLYAAIAAEGADARAVTAEALRAALDASRIGFWITLRSRRVQTNEVARSVAWLWPATLAGAGGRERPVLLFDVGASAGLNLVGEAVDVTWRRSTGSPLSIARDLDIRARTGFDPRPLDVRRADDCAWLRACVWPEQLDRFARLEAAIAAFRVAAPPPALVLARASSVPARLEDETRRHRGHLAIAYQSFVSGYIPSRERAAYEEGMRAWLASGPRGERMWAVLELVETGRPERSCALDVSVGTGGDVAVVRLGRTSYHPQTIDVAEDAEARLAQLAK
jgi:hypothetical protein